MAKHMAMVAALGLSLIAAQTALAADAPATIPAVGDKATDFTLETLDGKTVTLSDLTADSPVVLVVIRGWPGYQCPICMIQVADLKKHASELSERGAKVLFVYPGPGENLDQRAGEFLESRNLKGSPLPANFLFVTDPDYEFTNAYGLRWDAARETAYPSTFVIDTDGIVRYVKVSKTHGGRSNAGEVVKALDDLK